MGKDDLKPKDPCDPMDRSLDQPAPSYPGNGHHAAMHRVVKCPGCGRSGKIVENGNGMSPPHGWWIAPGPFSPGLRPPLYCSSECIAQTRRPRTRAGTVVTAARRPR